MDPLLHRCSLTNQTVRGTRKDVIKVQDLLLAGFLLYVLPTLMIICFDVFCFSGRFSTPDEFFAANTIKTFILKMVVVVLKSE